MLFIIYIDANKSIKMDQLTPKTSDLFSVNDHSQRSLSMFCYVHFVPTIRPIDNNNSPSPLSLVRSSFIDNLKENNILIENDYIYDAKHYAIKEAHLKTNTDNDRSVVKRKHSILEMLKKKRKATLK